MDVTPLTFSDFSPLLTQGITIILSGGAGAWGAVWYSKRRARAEAEKVEVEVDGSKAGVIKQEVENVGLIATSWREYAMQLKGELTEQKQIIIQQQQQINDLFLSNQKLTQKIDELEVKNDKLQKEIDLLTTPH